MTYKLTFLPADVSVDVDPANPPEGRDGLPGSILASAQAAGVELDHACGGFCACATCHVIVKEGLASCPEATEDEEDRLDEAPGLTSLSRLSCQAVPDGSCDVVVEIPQWNRNAVQEGAH